MDEIREWELSEQRLHKEKYNKRAPGLFSGNADWLRYSCYEVVQGKEGSLLIVPSDSAKVIIYNPFDYYPEILKDFLSLGHYFIQHADEGGFLGQQDIKLPILRFCNKYGLLRERPTDPYFRITPKESGEPVFSESDEDVEPLLDFVKKAYDLYERANLWNRFNECGCDPDDVHSTVVINGKSTPVSWALILSTYICVDDIGAELDFNGKWQLSWLFKTLLEALKIMIVTNITNESDTFKFCAFDRCGEPFIPVHPLQRCCCTSHANANRQARHRIKRKDGI